MRTLTRTLQRQQDGVSGRGIREAGEDHGGNGGVGIDNLYAKTKLKKGEIAKIATMTHDEIVSVIPERLGQKLLDANLKIMKTPPAWAPDLPINAEAVGWATNYSI